MHRYPVSPMGVLLLVFFDLFKVSKITMICSKLVKSLLRVVDDRVYIKNDSSGKQSNQGNFSKSQFVHF